MTNGRTFLFCGLVCFFWCRSSFCVKGIILLKVFWIVECWYPRANSILCRHRRCCKSLSSSVVIRLYRRTWLYIVPILHEDG